VISLFIFFAVSYALIFYLVAGLVKTDTFLLALCSVPALIAGLYTGDRLVARISQTTFTRVVYIVLVMMGLITLFKGAKALLII